jgi:hypothetical protein
MKKIHQAFIILIGGTYMETDIKKNYIEHESTNLLLKVDVNKKNGEYPLFI